MKEVKLEGQIYIAKIGHKWGLKGFTRNDMWTLGKLARKRYKLKTKRSRIVKKYVKRLITNALRNYDRSA
jgi:hypothetical protein